MLAHPVTFCHTPCHAGTACHVLHLGGQQAAAAVAIYTVHPDCRYHFAEPLESGERINLIVWLHGKYEVVRVAPYSAFEQLTPRQRWAAFARDRQPPDLGF